MLKNHQQQKYSSNWIISPIFGMKIPKNMSNHHPDNNLQSTPTKKIPQQNDLPTDPNKIHQVTRPVLDCPPTLAMQCYAVRHHWSDTLKSLESHNHQWTKSQYFPKGKFLCERNLQKFVIITISIDDDVEIKVRNKFGFESLTNKAIHKKKKTIENISSSCFRWCKWNKLKTLWHCVLVSSSQNICGSKWWSNP